MGDERAHAASLGKSESPTSSTAWSAGAVSLVTG